VLEELGRELAALSLKKSATSQENMGEMGTITVIFL